MFFYLYKVLFSGFLQFNSNFVDAQNNSKYRDWAPFKSKDTLEYNAAIAASLTSNQDQTVYMAKR